MLSNYNHNADPLQVAASIELLFVNDLLDCLVVRVESNDYFLLLIIMILLCDTSIIALWYT